MKYDYLIEYQNKETFKEKVKPNLKPNNIYYKAYLMNEDGDGYDCCIGFGFNCSLVQFKLDICQWLDEEVEGVGEVKIYTKKVLEDMSNIAIEHEYI